MLHLLQYSVLWRPSLHRKLWASKSQVSTQSIGHTFLWLKNSKTRWGSPCALAEGLLVEQRLGSWVEGKHVVCEGQEETEWWVGGGNSLAFLFLLFCVSTTESRKKPTVEEGCGGNSGSQLQVWKTKYQRYIYLHIYLFIYKTLVWLWIKHVSSVHSRSNFVGCVKHPVGNLFISCQTFPIITVTELSPTRIGLSVPGTV